MGRMNRVHHSSQRGLDQEFDVYLSLIDNGRLVHGVFWIGGYLVFFQPALM